MPFPEGGQLTDPAEDPFDDDHDCDGFPCDDEECENYSPPSDLGFFEVDNQHEDSPSLDPPWWEYR